MKRRIGSLLFCLQLCLDGAADASIVSTHATDREYGTPASSETTTRQNDSRKLIIGGTPAQHNEYPYFVHMGGCGGTLIAPNLVLTAGHCQKQNVKDYADIQVGRGDYRSFANDDVEIFRVVDHFRHDEYDGSICCGYHKSKRFTGVSYDFLILKLDGDSTMPTIRLNSDSAMPQGRQELHVIGFGDTDRHPSKYSSPQRLQEVTVFSIHNDNCIRHSIYPKELIDESTICAIDFRQDACNGDSGGPLLIKGRTSAEDVQIGVVSWGWGCATSQPGVYGRISVAYDWIQSIMAVHSARVPDAINPTWESQRHDAATPEKEIGVKERQQVYLAYGRSCGDLKSKHACCFARDGTYMGRPNDQYRGQECMPGSFSSNNVCEPREWVLENDQASHDSNFCDELLRDKTVVRLCTDITDATNCCASVDQEGSPCLYSRHNRGYKSGNMCESAPKVARYFPNDAIECSELQSIFYD